MLFHLPWYIAGPLIGLMVPILLLLRDKQLGISSSLRVLGSYVLPKLNYFKYDRDKDYWQVHFILGIVLIAFILFAVEPNAVPAIDESTYYGQWALTIYAPSNWHLFALGGVFIGFGARYADGCTAGHCIMGNALFSAASLITTLSFFAGGLLTSYFLIPLILPT